MYCRINTLTLWAMCFKGGGNVSTLIGVHCYMVQLWLGSAVMGACVVQGSVLLCAIVGRVVEGLYIQRGLVTSSWIFVDALRVVVS